MAVKWRSRFATRSLRQDVDEVVDLTKRYVREETIEPLKRLGRYVAFGAIGSVFVAFGSLFALIGLLRLLQTEFTAFTGDLSWLPYVIVMGLALIEIAVAGMVIVSGPARKRRSKKESS
jgi:hypothetical protein